MDFVINGEKAFDISANIAQYLRVKVTAATTGLDNTPVVSAAGIADVTIGITMRAGFVTTNPIGATVKGKVAVRLSSAQGTMPATLNGDGALAIGAAVYSAAVGKVSPTAASTAILLGYSLTTGAADGDLIEYLPV